MTSEEKLLQYLKQHPHSWTVNISRRCNIPQRAAMEMLKKMESEGLVVGTKHSNGNFRWK